jgi:hypothetical protein
LDEFVNSCPVCGTLHQLQDVYCSRCGHLLDSSDTIALEKQYIDKNIQYYTNKFFEMRVVGKDTSWNWSAFLVPIYWCIYRKIYGYGIGLFIAFFALGFFSIFEGVFKLIVYIAFGFYANNFYMQRIEKLVLESRNMTEHERQKHIDKYGGVNLIGSIVVCVFWISTLIILEILKRR